MLTNRLHWQFAKKLSPAWQERRLLCFAGSNTVESESSGEGKAQTLDKITDTIKSIQESFDDDAAPEVKDLSKRLEFIEGLTNQSHTVNATLNSNLFLPQDIDALSSLVVHEMKQDPNLSQEKKERLNPEDLDRKELIANIREKGKARQPFEVLLEEKLRSMDNLILLTQTLEKQSDRYKELTEQIESTVGLNLGGVTIAKLEEFDEELKQHGITVVNPHTKKEVEIRSLETWLQENTDAAELVAEKLGIDPVFKTPDTADIATSEDKEVKRAIDSITSRYFNSEEGADKDSNNKATKKNLVARGREYLLKLKRRLSLNRMDTSEPDQEGVEIAFKTNTVSELDATIQHLKEHIDKRLKHDAIKTGQFYLGRAQATKRRYEQKNNNKTGLEDAAKEGGYSIESYEKKVAEIMCSIREIHDESIDDPYYLSNARNRLKQLRELQGDQRAYKKQKDERLAQQEFEQSFTKDLQQDQSECIDWATVNAKRLEDVATILKKDTAVQQVIQKALNTHVGEKQDPVSFEDVLQSLPRLVSATYYIANNQDLEGTDLDLAGFVSFLDKNKRRNIDQLIELVEKPELATSIGKSIDALQQEKIPNSEQLQKDIEDVRNNLLPNCSVLNLPIAQNLNIKAKLRERSVVLIKRLKEVTRSGKKSSQYKVTCNEAAAELARLKDTFAELERLDEDHPQSRIKVVTAQEIKEMQQDPNTVALYNQDDHFVYIQENANQALVDHEIRHAIIDTVYRQTGAVTGLFSGIKQQLQTPLEENPEFTNREEQLMSLVDRWGYANKLQVYKKRYQKQYDDEALAERLAERRLLETMQEELLVRHTDWQEEQATGTLKYDYNNTEKDIFGWLDTLSHSYKNSIPLSEKIKQSKKNLKDDMGTATVASTQSLLEGGESGKNVKQPTVESTVTDVRDYHQEIREIERDITGFRAFLDSYPEYTDQLKSYVDEIEEAFQKFIKDEYNGSVEGMTDQDIENRNAIVGQKINILKQEHIKKVKDWIDDVDGDKMDMRNAQTSGLGIGGLLRSVRWVSVMDIVQTIKQGGEDIARMWKRRGEGAQAALGSFLTEWIPDNTIPGLEYFGRLKKEYNRRDKASEVEEVNQWKEALKDGDSFELQDLLRTSRNKDQIRAILELLSERGRLDWNDEGFMRTLNALSVYSMPIKACLRSDVLRDKWFNQIITDIYGDKEHYFNWRRQNDSNIKSKKGEFTSTADQLSNISHGLDKELGRMLKIFVESREKGDPIPQDVNPHLYEEIIDYSIRNGKMTMEDKFFYLVQGIRYQLLSIDRLRTLAGEEGGILNVFPFIDYFYGKNNSYADIVTLGKRLEQDSKDPKKRFKPGLKTTMFVRMEVAREKSVQERLKKGVGKQGENVDHDDIPYFLPELDQSGIKEWLSTLSGNRQKLSKEALKNGYVGFSMKFKTFAALAELDKQGLQKFSRADARNLAQTIGSYVLFDNILTRNTFDNYMQRPELSAYEYEQFTVMGLGDKRVKDYRSNMNPFIGEVLSDYMTNEQWNTLETNQQEFFNVPIGKNAGDKKRAEELFYKSDAFVTSLENKIMADPSGFISKLRTSHFHADGVAGEFTNEDVVSIKKEWIDLKKGNTEKTTVAP